jgi:hypothetical protein
MKRKGRIDDPAFFVASTGAKNTRIVVPAKAGTITTGVCG